MNPVKEGSSRGTLRDQGVALKAGQSFGGESKKTADNEREQGY